MQVRTQLVVIGVIAAGWAAGNFAVVRPVLAESQQADRRSLARLESTVALDPSNVSAARALSQRYLDLSMPRLAVETIGRMDRAVQDDPRVVLNTSKAMESTGDLQSASARISGALNRCTAVPAEMAEAAGCDVRTQIELAMEVSALDRMIEWNITPQSDPDRAIAAHDLALRPIRIAGSIH